MVLEERATGSVAWAVYMEYIRAAGGIWVIPAVIGSVVLSNGVNITTSYWLSSWTSNKYHLQRSTYVAVYAALGFSQAIFIFIFGYILTVTGNRATEKFHEKALLIQTLLILGFQSYRTSTNVILRYHTTGPNHQQVFQRCRYYG